jgi:hypothetical protein
MMIMLMVYLDQQCQYVYNITTVHLWFKVEIGNKVSFRYVGIILLTHKSIVIKKN